MPTAVLKTLVYSDIFDYPLRLDEIEKYLIGERAGEILIDRKLIGEQEGFYFLKGREEIVKLRKKRAQWSSKKRRIAQETADKLKIIPLIKMIGITGALAMGNCQENDDIDLLIITGADCLWLARLLIILLSPLLGIKRRKPKEKNVKDKICFNLFLEENHLKIELESLFLAHEICQVKPIFDRENIYNRFIKENEWIKKYLPNAFESSKFKVQSSKLGKRHPISQYPNILISLLDSLAFKLQYLYMKPRMTVEKVSQCQAFFHPVDLSDKIQKEFKRRIKSQVF